MFYVRYRFFAISTRISGWGRVSVDSDQFCLVVVLQVGDNFLGSLISRLTSRLFSFQRFSLAVNCGVFQGLFGISRVIMRFLFAVVNICLFFLSSMRLMFVFLSRFSVGILISSKGIFFGKRRRYSVKSVCIQFGIFVFTAISCSFTY